MLKLFKVDIESFLYVLAEDKEDAEDLVRNGRSSFAFFNADEILDGALCSATEVNTVKELDMDYGGDDLPFVSRKAYKYDKSEIDGLSCKQIVELYERKKEEIRRKADIERHNDKIQMKLPLEGVKLEPDPVICISCGYSGAIETFDAAMSIYNDIRCPKCGSTNCDRNSKYQKELFEGMEAIKNKTLDKFSI